VNFTRDLLTVYSVAALAMANRQPRPLRDVKHATTGAHTKGLKAKRKRERQARRQAQACARRRR